MWKAIDAVRKVGNVGAHMEKDVNLVIDVEPDEAGQLTRLIELLLHDWYVIRHEREEQFKEIETLAKAKEQAKSQPPTECGMPDIDPNVVSPVE